MKAQQNPKKGRKLSPSLRIESLFYRKGFEKVAGVDEVGRGCLAGPVVAAAVILPRSKLPKGIDDSKRLTALMRESLSEAIQKVAVAFAFGVSSVEEIDTINILQATRLAMKRAVESLWIFPDALLVDGREKVDIAILQRAVIKGDQRSSSVAAASILAKVYRDRFMKTQDEAFPGYDFASHKGYGSITHRKAIQTLGQTPLHRKTFDWTPV